MAEREVFITGIGLISCLGIGTEENWRKLCEGVSGIRAIRRFDASNYTTRIGGEIPEEFESVVAERLTRRMQKHTAQFSQLCLVGASLALEDAGLKLEEEDPEAVGICIGTGAAGMSYWEASFDAPTRPYVESLRVLDSLAVVKYMPNAPAAVASLHFGIEGPSLTVSSSCSSGAHAIGNACDLIRLGRVDVVIAGGVDAVVSKVGLSSFSRLQALSERNEEPARASRPFDRERDGFVLADGAGFLILETAGTRLKRDARRYARIRGYAAPASQSRSTPRKTAARWPRRCVEHLPMRR